MTKTKITIEIDNCQQCPFFRRGPYQSTDGFDRGCDWICTKGKKEKTIAGFVEWHEVDKTPVPDWCPARAEKLKK